MKVSKKYFFVVLLVSSFFLQAGAHPYYVSLCQVNFNEETQALEIQLKTFTDDLLLGLEKQGHSHLFLGDERENPETSTYMYRYFQKVLKFSVNGQAVKYNFVGREMENGAVWSYLEIPGVHSLETIDVQCTLLTEVYDTQSNMVQVQKGDEVKNLLLNKRNTRGSLSFKK